MTKIRTRFAPSPTGRMHVGNLRTALYAYLIAKHEGGDFILRIEDTDQERLVEGAVDIIYRTLAKTGLAHDEGPDKEGGVGPYVQSERQKAGIYLAYAKKLIEKGEAYYCFCDKERLAGLKTQIVEGKEITVYDKHCLSLSPEEVEEKLRRKPGIHAALITSPTYEGVVSDVAAIARIAHQYGVPLIVDEAHGAHFGFHTAFPQSAVKLGADAVVQSMHKVLPSFTQTALLHLNPGLIKPAEAARFLDIFETSSPSYVLMAGMEKCIRLLALHGEELFCVYEKRLKEFYEKAKTFSKIHLMCREDFAPQEAFALDASKLVISAKNTDLSGQMLYETLKNEYLLQMEMVSGFYVLGMTSIMDREEGFLRLSRALSAIDKTARRQTAGDDAWLVPRLYAPKEKRMEFYEAMDASRETVSFDRAVGRTAGSMVNLYPPGVPVLVPGETIDAQFIKNIRKYIKSGQKPRGIADIRNEKIEVVNFQ